MFEAYKQVQDDEFQRYIETFQNQFDKNIVIDVDELMRKALTKYDTINQRKEAGEQENQILALNAQPSQDQKIWDAIQSLQANAATKKDGKKDWSKKPPIAEWKKVPPGDKDPKSKMVTVKNKEKLFHWCPKHEQWTIHTPSECTLEKKAGEKNHSCNNNNKKSPDDAKTNEPKMTMAKALMSIMEQDIEE